MFERGIGIAIDKIQAHFRDEEGLSEEDAKLASENIFIDILIYAGVTFALVRSKVPAKLADRMGLTTKGMAKRKLSAKGEAKLAGKSTLATATTKVGAKEADEIATVVSASRGLSLSKVKSLLTIISTLIGVPTAVFFAAAQYIDFANWQGPYQKTFQALLSKVGINPDTPLPKASAISDEVWKRVYTVVETLKPSGISNPYSGVDKPYSRQALVEVVNEVAANIIKNGGDATFKNVIGIVLPLLQGVNATGAETAISAIPNQTATTTTTTTSKATTIPTVKVFTGVVSQGVVGAGLNFVARPDDLIENVGELKSAAANNLAPFLAALPSKVTYEIKVVSSIITANGFRQTGTTQRVQTGTNKDGSPKYKTVTNKFAVLYLYILSDRGTRTKLSTVVLGPVDSARFVMTSSDLSTLALELPKIVTTNSTDEIAKIVSSTPTEVVQAKDPTAPNISTKRLGQLQYYKVSTNGIDSYHVLPWGGNVPFGFSPITKAEYIAGTPKGEVPRGSDITLGTGIFAPNYIDPQFARFQAYAPTPSEQYYTESFFNTLDKKEQDRIKALYPNYSFAYDAKELASSSSAGTTDGSNSTKAGATASTLSEWYQAQGKSLPSVQERSITYQQLGLGQSSYYTGTAEQNTKLLLALKG